ncbi:MAG: hypothetical protein JW915_24570 [Chitinispirillaceae bacterium]|nr:hypothetical protein [Chitinispirillaceae bacterium]
MSQKTWIDASVKDLDPALDNATIENPFIRNYFDQILKTICFPVILMYSAVGL